MALHARLSPRSSEERSRRTVILLLLLFVIFEIPFEMTILNHKNSYWIKQRAIKAFGKDVECVAVGMSHAAYGVAADYFNCKALNLANVSQSMGIDCELVKTAINKCPNLKLVIMDVSYSSFAYSIFTEPGEPWRDCYSWLYTGASEAQWWQRILDPKYYVPSLLFGSEKIWKILRFKLKDKDAKDIDESTFVTPRGWILVFHEPVFSNKNGFDRVKFHEKQCRDELIKTNQERLTEVLEQCKKHNIKVLFLTLPVWKTYSQHMNKSRWNISRSIVQNYCNKYGCDYGDYLEDSRFVDADFVDDDHLSIAGALKMSKILQKEHIDKMLSESCQTTHLSK